MSKPIAYFVYEKNNTARWQPVVYYDKPAPKINDSIERANEQPLFETDIGTLLSSDKSPIFGALQAKYPSPQPVVESKFSLVRAEIVEEQADAAE